MAILAEFSNISSLNHRVDFQATSEIHWKISVGVFRPALKSGPQLGRYSFLLYLLGFCLEHASFVQVLNRDS